jgi:anti-anti-sigma regulatory factor
VLKITVEENPGTVALKLEGRLAGPWVEELNRLWEQTAPALNERKLFLDLRETTYADADGIRVLKAIYSQTGAAILADTQWTQYLAEEVTTTQNNHAAQEG